MQKDHRPVIIPLIENGDNAQIIEYFLAQPMEESENIRQQLNLFMEEQFACLTEEERQNAGPVPIMEASLPFFEKLQYFKFHEQQADNNFAAFKLTALATVEAGFDSAYLRMYIDVKTEKDHHTAPDLAMFAYDIVQIEKRTGHYVAKAWKPTAVLIALKANEELDHDPALIFDIARDQFISRFIYGSFTDTIKLRSVVMDIMLKGSEEEFTAFIASHTPQQQLEIYREMHSITEDTNDNYPDLARPEMFDNNDFERQIDKLQDCILDDRLEQLKIDQYIQQALPQMQKTIRDSQKDWVFVHLKHYSFTNHWN